MDTQVNEKDIPLCFVRNNINHFVKLISQWTPLKKSKFPRTRQLFIRSITLFICCVYQYVGRSQTNFRSYFQNSIR